MRNRNLSILLTEATSYKLWESAGRRLVEAELTADQIQQLFTSVAQGADAAGSNRTLVGKGKDAASAVNAAWEDLKSKVQNSGPVKNVDAMYDQAAEKLKQATGGDAGVMQYVQKYRNFATAHPIAQSLIYSALIAAAGISGVGLGGAAALGLFKMVDKLLQGEKFSSAAYSGAKTGAMAYGAAQIGKAMQGPAGPEIQPYGQNELVGAQSPGMQGSGYTQTATGQTGDYGQPTYNLNPTTPAQDFSNLDNASLGQSMKMNPMLAQRAGMPGITGDQMVSHPAYQAMIQKFGDTPGARKAAMSAAKAAITRGESVKISGKALTESQITSVFRNVSKLTRLHRITETEDALAYATKAHSGQTRSGGDPYITHPMRVADHIRQYKQSHNLDAIIRAAYLHDTIEDTDTTHEALHDLFGGLVASLVQELTSDPEQIKKMGKAAYLAHKMAAMSSYALVIKLADRLDNVKDITTARTPQWRAKYKAETEHILDYIEKNRALSGTHQSLIGLIRNKIGELDNPEQEVDEGLPQTLRKVVPGYAKREIDKKMDAGKFGKTDADKDANFQRYKKIQDKLNEFAPDGFNGDDNDEGFSPEIAKMAQEDGFTKGVSLVDGATLERAMTINYWHSQHGGMYKQYFAKGFKQGRMNKINHDNKQYNLNLKLMKDGSIRHGEQGVAEGSRDQVDTNTVWEVSFDYGPHQSGKVKIRASSQEEAEQKGMRAAKKLGHRFPQLNWAMPAEQEVDEGAGWDAIKAGASKIGQGIAQGARTIGGNITNKVTADKLNSAWTKAGSPTDSNAVADVIRKAGVDDSIITQSMTAAGIEAPAAASDGARVEPTMTSKWEDSINSLGDASPEEKKAAIAAVMALRSKSK